MSKSIDQLRAERNLVAHFESGTSDKVYMACIRWDFAGKRWAVLGKWGRRGKTLSSQVKWEGTEYGTALSVQRDLFANKVKEGYVDVDSSRYRGPVNRQTREIAANMETGDPEPRPKADEDLEKAVMQADEEPVDTKGMVAVCTDNAGVEAHFDRGIEYVFEAHKDKKMLWVYDKVGVKTECFRDRFRLVKEG